MVELSLFGGRPNSKKDERSMPGQSETPANKPQDLLKRPRFILGEKRRQHYRDRIYREAEGKGRAPDYVGVGAQRAGTSRWHTLITAHPDVVDVTDPTGRVVKEIHWFDQPLAADTTDRDQAYFAWFDAPEDKTIGEFTPRYLYDLWPIDRLAELAPDLKIFVFLRDPLSRLVSALQFYDQRGIVLDRDAVRESIWRGLYSNQLDYLFQRFPREQVFVGIHEIGSTRPTEELASMYRFLDLDDSFVPDGMDRRVNGSAKIEIDERILATARTLYEADRPRLEAVLPDVDLSAWT